MSECKSCVRYGEEIIPDYIAQLEELDERLAAVEAENATLRETGERLIQRAAFVVSTGEFVVTNEDWLAFRAALSAGGAASGGGAKVTNSTLGMAEDAQSCGEGD